MSVSNIEKTIRLEHGNLRAIVPDRRTIDAIDYSTDDFKPSGNNLLDEWRVKRLSEYLTYKFPLWRRSGLKSIDLPRVESYKALESIDEEGLNLLDSLDFEGTDRKFVLMADIFSSSGNYIVVEEDTTLIVDEFSQYDNMLIDVRRGTLNLVRCIERPFFIGNLRILVRQDASLNLYNLYIGKEPEEQEQSVSNFLSSSVFIQALDHSKIKVKDFYFGGKINAGYFGMKLNGEDIQADVRPYYLANKDNVVDILYFMRFYKQKSYGNVDSKGVLADKSKVVFRGIMDILSGAKEVEAHQSNHATLISDAAKVEAVPSLMVDENDVIASHAASSSPVDENMVFYLMTRGIPEKEAQNVIVKGIFEILKEELEPYNLKGVVEDVLNRVVG